MRKVFAGLNAEDKLGRKRRFIEKYTDGTNFYTIVEGNLMVDVRFMDTKVCEQGEVIPFINKRQITIGEFNDLKNGN